MKAILFIALGGMVGAVLRYLAASLAGKMLGDGFAYGTLLVNVVGCLAIGFLAGWGFTALENNPHARLFVVTGVLGSLTTFSTFGWETMQYMQDGRWQLALANMALNLIVGIMAVAGGFSAGQSLLTKVI
ncbi:MAG: fluoride efflux transporter CrcB [Planctomycetaceae bacterium]|nr:fluoride efflux transporter CrcB [Planctomycetaceae bacterium]|tara:strand:+ start:4996 stop:5385 length:390 start_codon:yes stop_codon:yes gene_type:complete